MKYNHEEYVTLVDNGVWPSEPEVPLLPSFSDDRGVIQNILLMPVTSLAVIRSNAKTLRANHYHKTDWHYTYVISGKVLYFERNIGDTEIPDPVIYHSDTMFFTPPMKEHCMAFDEPTVIITAAKNVRSHENHENDLVRVNFVTHEDVWG